MNVGELFEHEKSYAATRFKGILLIELNENFKQLRFPVWIYAWIFNTKWLETNGHLQFKMFVKH